MYQKKNRAVVFVYNFHNKIEIDAENGKPQLILDYSMTIKEMFITRRCPLFMFYATIMNTTR